MTLYHPGTQIMFDDEMVIERLGETNTAIQHLHQLKTIFFTVYCCCYQDHRTAAAPLGYCIQTVSVPFGSGRLYNRNSRPF